MTTKMKMLTAVAAVLLPGAAQAAVTISIVQSGTDVTITAAGTLNTSGLLPFADTYSPGPAVIPSQGAVFAGVAGSPAGFFGLSGPSDFGFGNYTAGVRGTGSIFGLSAAGVGFPVVYLSRNFVSGSAIDSSGALANTTLAALGLTGGTYVFTAPADTITVQIGAPAVVAGVPEPATWGMMIAGFGLVGATLRRRRAAVRVAFG